MTQSLDSIGFKDRSHVWVLRFIIPQSLPFQVVPEWVIRKVTTRAECQAGIVSLILTGSLLRCPQISLDGLCPVSTELTIDVCPYPIQVMANFNYLCFHVVPFIS